MKEKDNPEDIVKEELTEWMKKHSDVEVYWEQKNQNNHPVFKTKNPNKPDLLIIGKYNTVVEVKTGFSKANTYDGVVDCYEYWLDYYKNEQEYNIGPKKVDIHNFILATRHSIEGHLYPSEYETKLTYTDFNETRRYAVRQAEIPPQEYNMTEQSIRILWRLIRKSKSPVGTGALLSNVLEGVPDGKPKLLIKIGEDQLWTAL